MGFSKSCAKREVHSNTSLPQETRETSNKQSKSTLTAARKRRTATTTKNQSYYKGINHKDQSRNEKELKETTAKTNKIKSWFFERETKLTNH